MCQRANRVWGGRQLLGQERGRIFTDTGTDTPDLGDFFLISETEPIQTTTAPQEPHQNCCKRRESGGWREQRRQGATKACPPPPCCMHQLDASLPTRVALSTVNCLLIHTSPHSRSYDISEWPAGYPSRLTATGVTIHINEVLPPKPPGGLLCRQGRRASSGASIKWAAVMWCLGCVVTPVAPGGTQNTPHLIVTVGPLPHSNQVPQLVVAGEHQPRIKGLAAQGALGVV